MPVHPPAMECAPIRDLGDLQPTPSLLICDNYPLSCRSSLTTLTGLPYFFMPAGHVLLPNRHRAAKTRG
jgi:hypothetical protein